ncbi:MAG TPA: PilZ domain-containing protein [Bryobacteraceae bacterium]|jgi:hypothetical protein
MATVFEAPRSFVVGRMSPQQITAVKSRLAECYKRAGRTGSERRQEARFATDEPARMKVLQPIGPSAQIRVLDISRGGLKITVPELLPPGTVLQIHMKSAIAFAEVRYCTMHGAEFHAGVRFQDVFWAHEGK